MRPHAPTAMFRPRWMRWCGGPARTAARPPGRALGARARRRPGGHARDLARRGLDATALDLNPAIARGEGTGQGRGVSLTVVDADMRDFSIPASSTSPSRCSTRCATCCRLTTCCAIWPPWALTSAMAACTSWSLRTRPTSSRPSAGPAAMEHRSRRWTAACVGRAGPDRPGHADHQGARQRHLSQAGRPVRTVTDVGPTVLDRHRAGRRDPAGRGLTLVASYGDFDDDLPVDAAEAWRMILVLRRE